MRSYQATELKGGERMKTFYLRITLIALTLLFFSQGCSFYAGFHSSRAPNTAQRTAKIHQEVQANN